MAINWEKARQSALEKDRASGLGGAPHTVTYKPAPKPQMGSGNIFNDMALVNTISGPPKYEAPQYDINMAYMGGPDTYAATLRSQLDRLTEQRDTLGAALDPYDTPAVEEYNRLTDQISKKTDELYDFGKSQGVTPGKVLADSFFGGLQDFIVNAGTTALKTLPGNALIDHISSGLTGVKASDVVMAPQIASQQAYQGRIADSQKVYGDWYTPASTLAQGVGGAMPQAALAIMSGGLSAPALLGNPSLSSSALAAVSNMAQSPLYWTAFAQSYGSSYNDAIARGATEDEAQAASLLSGLIVAGVEMTGGLETLPANLKTGGTSAVTEWVMSALDEGQEEVIQGIIDRLMSKVVYAPETPFISTTDPTAPFNPVTAAQEFGGGVSVGGLLGGGMAGVQAAMNAQAATPQGRQVPQAGQQPTTPQDAAQTHPGAEAVTPTPAPQSAAQPVISQRDATKIVTPVDSDTHIDNRDFADVGKRGVNAFQFDNPVVHPYYSEAAQGLLYDLTYSIRGERFGVKDSDGYYTGQTVGIKRSTIPEIESLLDDADLSYADIQKALESIVTNNGQENYAAAKKVEIVLDDILTNGYTTIDGYKVPPNQEYIDLKENAGGNFMSNEEWDSLVSTLEPGLTNVFTPQGLPQGTGAMSAQFPYVETLSQTKAADSITTQADKDVLGQATHKVLTNEESRAQATERLAFDYEGEKAALEREEWGAAETVIGYQYLADALDKAHQTGDYSEATRWKKIFDSKGTVAGQALQSRQQFVNAPEYIEAEAVETLNNETTRKLSPPKKAEIIQSVREQAEAYNKIQPGDIDALIKLIEQNNVIRRTTGLFNKSTSKQMDWALNHYGKNYEGAEALLRDVAVAQIRNIAGDYQQVSPLEAVKSYRIMSMLSKAATIFRNLVSNNITDPLDALSNDIVVPLDMLLSKITGTRSVSADKSWLSSAKRQGSIEGALKSFIQVGLDADVSDAMSKYEQRSGRVFKMTGSFVERLLSTWNKYENYALHTTDEFQKGGIRSEAQRGLESLKERGKLAEDALPERADTIAKERTFQADSLLAQATIGLRSAMNKLGLTDKQGGSIGVGDVAIPFAKVPANLATMSANYSALGLVNGVKNLGRVLWQAKNGTLTPEMQAKAVTDIGRGVIGTAGLAMATALALKGIISVAGSDDKDKESLESSEGKTGTQFNVTALWRWINGESADWQDGDYLVSIGFMEILNAQMAAGALLAEEIKNSGGIGALDVAKATLDATLQSVLDMPALQQINDLVMGYRYSSGERPSEKMGDAALGYATSQLGSLIPNFIAGIASGTDETVRDKYAGDTLGEQTLDSIFSRIPGLREGLDPKLDPFGNERSYTDNALLNFFNANILPGYVTEYSTSGVSQELSKLYNETDGKISYPDRNAPNKISLNSQSYDLTSEEKAQYLKTSGQKYYTLLDEFFASDFYKSLSNDEIVKYVSQIKDHAKDTAKLEVVNGRGLEGFKYQHPDIQTALDNDISITDYFKAYQIYKEIDALENTASYKANTFAPTLDKELANLSDGQRTVLKDALGYFSHIPQSASAYEEFTSAGLTTDQAESLYEAFAALEPEEGKTQVSNYQKISAILDMGFRQPQTLSLIGEMFTTTDRESLLPDLTNAEHLLSLYSETGDSELISMTIPSEFSDKKVVYTLTAEEKDLFKETYLSYFNSMVTSLSTAEQVKRAKSAAYDAAKVAVIGSRY